MNKRASRVGQYLRSRLTELALPGINRGYGNVESAMKNLYRCPISLVKPPNRGAYTAYFLLLDYNATNSWDSLSLSWLAEILNPSERR